MISTFRKRFWVVFFFFLLASCSKDLDRFKYDTTLVIPIAKGKVTLSDVVDDFDSTLVENNDKSLSLVYRTKIYEYQNPMNDLVDIQIAPLIKDFTLQSLELGSQQFSDSITLGELMEGNPFFVFGDKTKIPNFFGGLTFSVPVDPIDVDFSDILQRAVLTQGNLLIELDNRLPLDVSNVTFTILNTQGREILYQGSYSVLSGQKISDQVDLAAELNGQAIEGQLMVELRNTDVTIPSGPDSIYIDYSDYFAASIEISGIKVSEADAVFPSQNIIDEADTVGLQGLGEVELTQAIIKKGRISAAVTSTVESAMHMEYYVPSAVKNGSIFSFVADVEAAPPNGRFTFYEEFLYDGYDFDFTAGGRVNSNAFYNAITARIDSTGDLIHLSLDDTLSIAIQVEELIPSYVVGYMGQPEIDIPEDTIEIDVFSSIKNGDIEFEEATLKLTVDNGLGVPAQLQFNQLVGINSSTGKSVVFPAIPNFEIAKATDLGTGSLPSTQSLDVQNVASILNILPDKIYYNISGELNPNGNIPPYDNFIYDNSTMEAYLDLEVPFSVKTSGLVLRDTVLLDFEQISSPEEIKSGIIRLFVKNQFPFQATLTSYFLDGQGTLLDSLSSNAVIAPATQVSGMKAQAVESLLEFPVSGQQIENILKAEQVALHLGLSTSGNEFAKVYTDYSIDVQLIVEFKYQVNTDL